MARKRFRNRHVGRLRIKAAELLTAAFPQYDIKPEDIVPVTGHWLKVDVYRWQVFAFRKDKKYTNGDRIPISLGCWYSLTSFVKDASKYGCTVNEHDEVYANESPKGPPS